MRRRDLLRGLLALPFAPLVARLLPAATGGPAGMLEGLSAADQTSVWLVDWGPMTATEITHRQALKMAELHPIFERLERYQRDYAKNWRDVSEHVLPKKNWLKESIRGN